MLLSDVDVLLFCVREECVVLLSEFESAHDSWLEQVNHTGK